MTENYLSSIKPYLPRRVRAAAFSALALLMAVAVVGIAGVTWAGNFGIDPALEARLEAIEVLAKAHPDRAQAALNELQAQSKQSAEPLWRLRVELVRAWIEVSSGAPEAALQRLDAMREALSTTGTPSLRARALNLRANVLSDLNRFPEMGDVVKEEQRLAEEAGDENLLASAAIDRAWYASQTGNYAEGAVAISVARKYAKSPRQSAETAQVTAFLANMVDDTKTTLESAQLAARYFKEVDDPIGEAEACVMIAASERQLGHPKESEVAARRALRIRQAGDDTLGQAIAWMVLADAQFDQDQVIAALESNSRVLALIPPAAKVYRAMVENQRARFLTLSGRIAEARGLLASAAEVAEADVGRSARLQFHEQLGRLAMAIGDYRRARAEDRTVQSLRWEHAQGSIERQLGALRLQMERAESERDIERLREKAELSARAARMTQVAFVLALLLVAGLAWAYRRQRQLSRRLEAMTQTDSLTGLLNRRGLFEVGNRLLARCRYEKQPFAVLLVDVDYFKQTNDAFGHPVGDRALACIASVLGANLRPGDHVGRYGGEEFAVLLSADAEQACNAAERLRDAVARLAPTWHDQAPSLTISGGLASAASDESFEQLIDRADAALYRAKQSGRNRIECDAGSVAT